MKVLVCIKQVPGTNRVEVDPVTGVLKRDGVASKMNPYDLFALETAFQIVERMGGSISTLTMGPPQAKTVLLESIWMGADAGVLLSDRKFAGADVAATSYVLSLGVKELGEFDLILCGKQTTDGDTAQVGPELAERLGIEHAANVTEISAIEERTITVRIDLDDVIQTQCMELPCLLTMDKDVNTPRLPSYLRRKRTDEEQQIRILSAAQLKEVNESRLGLKGSPTQVERIFPPKKNMEKEMFMGTATEQANMLYQFLHTGKFI